MPTARCMMFCFRHGGRARCTPHDGALVHHGHAVADADHLLHVAGDHQDGDAAVGEGPHQVVDLVLRADVDAARRLVEDHHLGPHREPFGQHDLLLVAARQRGRGGRRGRGLDAQGAALALRVLGRPAVLHQRAARIGDEVRQGDVVSDRILEDEPRSLAVLWDEIDAAVDGVAWFRDADLLAVQAQRSVDIAVDAEDRAREFRPPRPDQSGETQDLAAMQRQRDVALRIGGGLDADDLQHLLGRGPLRHPVERFEVAPDHQADHRVVLDLGALQRPDHDSVAQHHDAVRAMLDLVQPMRDEDDGDAARLQVGDDGEQPVASR